MAILLVPISHIYPNPWQTRNLPPAGEYIKDLALDIAANGLLQTPIGRFTGEVGEGELEGAPVQLAFGHNRLAAYRWLYDLRDNSDIQGDWSKMPVDVRVLSDEQMADMAWAENDKRQDFTPLERALAIRKRMEDFKWSQKDIAEHLRISAPVVSNALRMLDLPEDILQLVSKGKMSERATLALLTLFDLPESLRKEAESQYGTTKPSNIIEQAINGLSSDGIREHIESLVKHFSKDLHQAIWDLDYIFVTGEAIYWPECRTCELRHKPLNVCTSPSCYEAKGRAWKADYLQQASQASGILPLEPEIGFYEATQLFYRTSAQTILTSGCENLRLAYQSHLSGPFSLEDKGYPQAAIVCRQKHNYCQCLKGLEILEAQRRREDVQAIQDTPRAEEPVVEYNEATAPEEEEIPEEDGAFTTVYSHEAEPTQPAPAQPTAEDLHELVRQEKRNEKEYKKLAKEAQDQAAQLIVEGLAADNPSAWRLIYDRVAAGERWENRPNDVLELRKGIAEKIIAQHISYVAPQDVPDRLKKYLIEAGLKAPVF
jgi:ParB/RepB/Spo0J family partition protein